MIITDRDWEWTVEDLRRWAEEAGHYQMKDMVENYRRFLNARGNERRHRVNEGH